MTEPLPIEHVIPKIRHALENRRTAVVQAPPGAGKTTRVPLALIDEPWLSGQKIVMLEPRRLATRTSAARMAEIIGEPLGKTVGYHIRMDRVSGPETKIEVVTEGILTRRIQNDPALAGIGLVIFDEFHERNLNGDLGLALCLETLEVLRDDLRILVMSATIDVQPVAGLMSGAAVIKSEGKSWPVTTKYLFAKPAGRQYVAVETRCAMAIKKALTEEQGDLLVFLPGVGEIRRLETLVRESVSDGNISIIPLYGNLSKKDQDQAIQPSPSGSRKVVLATSIAETSITIEGVKVVIDSGLMRVPRFFPGTGMSRLETLPVTKSSADQRRGRAGRTGPGICYRLWSKESHSLLSEFISPEILNADLARFALELAVWGVSAPEELKWIDMPPSGAFEQAKTLLKGLGALESTGALTAHGKELASIGIHPRLGHMMLKGKEMGVGALACRIAALLGERDFINFTNGFKDTDIRLRLDIIGSMKDTGKCSVKGVSINRGVVFRILKNSQRFEKLLHIKADRIKTEKIDLKKAGTLLAYAYPERIALARSRDRGAFLMASGSGAFIDETDPLVSETWIVAADLDGNRQNARIYRALSYSEEDLERDFGHMFVTQQITDWDKRSQCVIGKNRVLYGELLLKEEPLKETDPEKISEMMLKGIRKMGIGILPWNKILRNWQARVIFLNQAGCFNDLPDMTDDELLNTMEIWLKPFLSDVSSVSQLKKVDLKAAIFSMFTWEQKQLVEKNAPTHFTVPSGSRIPLEFGTGENKVHEYPILAVRLQEMFGLEQTPRIAGGNIPVTLHLLSPASRPMQVTQDLESFWKNTYADVKKDLKGRYPKHYWPDDPLKALPTNRVKPKKT